MEFVIGCLNLFSDTLTAMLSMSPLRFLLLAILFAVVVSMADLLTRTAAHK